MSVAEYFTHSYSGRIWISNLILLLVLSGLGNSAAEAQQFLAKKNSPHVIISAPEPLQDLLARHFELPAVPIADETGRATFMRRAQREIRELLATEGYFKPTIALNLAPSSKIPVLEITPGPRTFVSEVSIEFRGDLASDEPGRRARVEKLRAAWSLGVGQPFRSPIWEEAKAILLSSVAEENYAAAEIEE
ncbi:MAG TPA: outer membrane protein assembly factor, partial [Nitrosospira sp.]|nr:outer membrane protein assembly factor [Nitrosospira sp.]